MKKKNILGLLVLGSLMVLVGTGFTFSNQACSVDSQATLVNSSSQSCVPVNCETGEVCTQEELKACQSNKSSADKTSAMSISQTKASCNPADCDPSDCDPANCDLTDCDKTDCSKIANSCSSKQAGCTKASTSDDASI